VVRSAELASLKVRSLLELVGGSNIHVEVGARGLAAACLATEQDLLHMGSVTAAATAAISMLRRCKTA